MSDADELENIRQQKRDQLLDQHHSTPVTEPSGQEAPVHVTDGSHFQDLIASHDLILVDFYADWCGPCQMLEPTLEELAAEHPVTVINVDIDQHRQLAQEHGVSSVPTLVLYANGTVVEQLIGVQDKPTLSRLISQHT